MKRNQRGQLLLKILILSLIPLIPHRELAAPYVGYKLSKFKHLPLKGNKYGEESALLFHRQKRVLFVCVYVCVFVSTKKVNANLTYCHSLALCSRVTTK